MYYYKHNNTTKSRYKDYKLIPKGKRGDWKLKSCAEKSVKNHLGSDLGHSLFLRLYNDVKKYAELVCSEISIPLSFTIIIYLKKLYRKYRILLEVSADPIYS